MLIQKNLKPLVKQLAILGVVTSSLVLSACQPTPKSIVRCEGVDTKNNQVLYIDKGLCKKLAGGTPVAIHCDKWRKPKNGMVQCVDKKISAPVYKVDDYVKCYGAAAASMNDCGTSTTACGGTIHVAKQHDAWIAIPDGLCKKIKGAVAQPIKKD